MTSAATTPGEGPSADEKRAALQQLLESSSFVRAGQLQSFLRFVCEMEIAGRAAELSEHRIGVEALGRPPDYSPAEDAAVRRRAIDLRVKIDEAYANELAEAPLRIDLPKGRYVPRFLRAERAPARDTAADVGRRTGFSRRALVAAFAAGVGVTSLAFWLSPALRPGPPGEAGVVREAEASTLGGRAASEYCAHCSGSHRVRAIGNTPENFVQFHDVMARAAGDYALRIDYLLNGSRSFFVSVNDGPGVEVPLQGQSWSEPSSASLTVRLQAGSNRIKFYNDRAFAPDLDRVVVPREPRS
jgi:hypothetical protein